MKQAIVIVGGYNSIWATYLKIARDLEDVTGLQAIGVPLMPWHWWRARHTNDASHILQKVDETVVWARRRFGADRFILVGHSAGGIVCRLYLHEEPVWGHTYAGVEHTTNLITLGSPHCSSRATELGWFLADEANRMAPGTPYADRIRYLTVVGRWLQGSQNGSYRQQRAYQAYRFFSSQGDAWGDGITPVESAGLDGAENLVLEGIAHSRKHDHDWYGGSKAIIRRWWPRGDGHD